MDYSNLRSRFQAATWSPAQEDILLEPYTYISANPGKEIRSKMIEAFDLWLNVPKADLEAIKQIVRMLHNASLLMDDVEDNSELRRGLPVANTVYGVPQTINTANYVYFLAVQELLKLETLGEGDDEGVKKDEAENGGGEKKGKGKGKGKAAAIDLVAVVNDELLQLHRGQGLDLFWRDSLQCPTEEQYFEMVLGKTGGLFRIAVKLMMARSDNDVDYVPLVNLISVFFQIRDDYMNLQSAEYEDNKGFAEDLSEGKFSFPVVHGIRADPTNRQILNVLQKRTNSHSLKTYIVNHLRHTTKSFAYTREVLKVIREQLEDEVKRLGGNVGLEAILRKLGVPEEGDDERSSGDVLGKDGKKEVGKNGNGVANGNGRANGLH